MTLYKVRALVYPSGGGTITGTELITGEDIQSGGAFDNVAHLESKMKSAGIEHAEPVRNVHYIPAADGMYEFIYEFPATEEQLKQVGFFAKGALLS